MGRYTSNGYGYLRGSRTDNDIILEVDNKNYRIINDLVTEVEEGRTGYYAIRSVYGDEASRILEIYNS